MAELTPHCTYCGRSVMLRANAVARWDIDDKDWVLESVHHDDEMWCEDENCDGQGGVHPELIDADSPEGKAWLERKTRVRSGLGQRGHTRTPT